MANDFVSDMHARGLVHQATHESALRQHLATGLRRGYVGFDPTADSLTIGNLMGIMALRRLQLAGHAPVVVAGGGTGLIGDPSGKSAERQLMTPDVVEANVNSQRRIFEALLDFSRGISNPAQVVNNSQWLGSLSYLDALRDIGKHFSVNMMIQKESVRERLHNREQGISYTEFSYMILQAYDFHWLHENMGVTLQMGGSDQWGNIVGGIDLARRKRAEHEPAVGEAAADSPDDKLFGLTWPLVTKSDGTKFGKTESGAIWLTRDRTSPYAYFQFWLNAADEDAAKFLRFFTLLPIDEITAIEARHAANPGAREAQRVLAPAATALLHGETEAHAAETAAAALFSGDIAHLSQAMLQEVFAHVPASEHSKARLEGDGVDLVDLLIEIGLAQSKRESREFLSGGSVTVNGRKSGLDERLKQEHLLHGTLAAIRRGKKNWHLTRWA